MTNFRELTSILRPCTSFFLTCGTQQRGANVPVGHVTLVKRRFGLGLGLANNQQYISNETSPTRSCELNEVQEQVCLNALVVISNREPSHEMQVLAAGISLFFCGGQKNGGTLAHGERSDPRDPGCSGQSPRRLWIGLCPLQTRRWEACHASLHVSVTK